MKKLVLRLIVSAFILALTLPQLFYSYPADAANATWINASTITIGNKTYFDGSLDNNYTYTLQNATACLGNPKYAENISANYFQAATQGTLTTYTPSETNISICDAVTTTIAITNADTNSQQILFWQNPNAIQTSDNQTTFNYTGQDNPFNPDPSHPEIGGYWYGASVDGSTCISYINAYFGGLGTTHSAPNTGSLYLSLSTKSLSGVVSLQSPLTPGAKYVTKDATKKDGCYLFQAQDVKLYSPQNAASPPTAVTAAPGGCTDPLDCGNTPADACAINTLAFAWLICPAIDLSRTIANDAFSNMVVPLLTVTPLSQETGLQAIWSSTRNVADVFFIIVFMVIIFGSTLSIGIDSYTIKKALPRFVIAVIAVQFSFFICEVLVDFGNIAGSGIAHLIQTAVASSGDGTTQGFAVKGGSIAVTAILGTVAGAASIWALGVGTILLGVLGLLIALAGAVITLILRLLIIEILVVAAPLALVAWVLPNTSSLFKFWWKNLLRAILMFPLAVAVMGIANAINPIAGSIQNSGLKPTAIQTVTSVVAGFLPIIALFSLPATFKMAGSLMGVVGKQVSGRAGKMASGVTGGQFAKDVKQGRMEKGLMRASASKTGFGRVMGRAQAGVGFLSPTSASARRLAGATSKLEDTRGKEYGRQLQNLQTLPPDEQKATLKALAAGKWDDPHVKGKGFEENHLMQAAAINEMAQRRDTQSINEVHQTLTGEQKSQFEANVRKSSSASAIFERAPHLAGSSYGGMTADRLSKLDGVGAQGLVEHITKQQTIISSNPVGSAEHTKATQELTDVGNSVNSMTAQQKGTVNAGVGRALYNAGVTNPGIAGIIGGRIDATGKFL